MDQSTPHKLEINASRGFTSWLVEHKVSLAFSTYQSGKLFLIGIQPDGKLSVFERTFDRCMGLCAHGSQTLYMSMLYQVWRMENALEPSQTHEGYDALYVPKRSHVTGDIDIHDMALDTKGRLIFVNTLFSCLATLSETHSFKALWKPPFISKLAAEDRCHLNGLAMRDGKPRYVTTVSRTDIHEGWREHRMKGGIVMEITRFGDAKETSAIICEGLSMPHSPRFYRDKLWVHNSGTGHFGFIDLKQGVFEEVCFCPGYLRGMDFVKDYAVVGLSQSRKNKTFSGLALEENLAAKQVEPRCGLYVISLTSGDVVHSMRMEGVVQELYDVVALPGVHRPRAVGFKTEEIRHIISVEA